MNSDDDIVTELIDILRENCTGDCVKVSRIAIIPCFICMAAEEIERLRRENDWYKAVNTQLQADLTQLAEKREQ